MVITPATSILAIKLVQTSIAKIEKLRAVALYLNRARLQVGAIHL